MTYRGWQHVKKQRYIPRIEGDAEGLRTTPSACPAYLVLRMTGMDAVK
jgi:hypothetical protein